ncbi:protein smoothened [Chelonus insularis]|uniref:protein smoothened n=1 Tax=Chelonus insularis TaxID=460826 RepID=UPI001588A365|nr:protein smoothened [Chelonus insularis]
MFWQNYHNYYKASLCLAYLFVFYSINEVNSVLSESFEGNENGENGTWKNLDLAVRLHDPSYLLERYPHVEPTASVNCRKQVKCVKMKYSTCMGTPLPFTMTTVDLLPEPMTQDQIQERLKILQVLRHIPKCWAVVQPFLCSLFMPQCNNNTVELPSQEFCKKVSGPCRILFNHTIWPNFINCENTKLFPKMCNDYMRDYYFNTSTKCINPLISTENSLAIFEGVEGCGTQCNDPLYTPEQQNQIHSFIFWGAVISGVFNLFTVITFLIDWRSANKYPALVIFYINCCFLISCIGWLAQFTSGNRESIVCRKDGTLRMNEPSGGSLSCVVVFVLIYYSSMAATVWFVILTYAWHMRFQALSTIQDKIDKKSAYFHLIAWCLPLVLTVTIIALGEVDGNSVTGICFVGYTNHIIRSGFLLGPILVGILIGGYFLSRGLVTLIRLKISSQEIISERASVKIRGTIIRMGCFSVFTFLAVVITVYCHMYDFQNSSKWHQSFRDYMICLITKYSEDSECKMKYKPSVTKLQLHLLAPFLAGVLMSSWVWTSSTIDTWIRFLRRTFNCESEEPVKLKKHKVIAQAFAKRKTFNNAGRLSISFHNTHDDPVGLNFDLNSVASQDFSSTWAAALPKFVTRRGALVGGNTASVSSNRRNSVDSEISFSVQRVSVQSRRNSLDSQISVQISEVKATRKVASSSGARSRRGKRRRDFGKSRSTKVGPLFRRGSTTSQESQLGAQILNALTMGGTQNIPQVPNLKRRSATAGLDGGVFNSKVIDEKNVGILLPFLFHNQTDSDENVSSEEKRNLQIMDKKNIDVEAGNITNDKNENDSDSEESQADEETKMITCEEPQERCKSKSSNKSSRSYNHETGRSKENRKSKFIIQDETVLKQFLQETSEMKINDNEKENYRNSGIGDLNSSLTSYCPELSRIMQSDGHSSAREIATQTSLPLDILEMEELKQSIDEIINSRNCSSKGTQISPQLNKSNRKADVKTMATSPVTIARLSKEGRRNERNHKNV